MRLSYEFYIAARVYFIAVNKAQAICSRGFTQTLKQKKAWILDIALLTGG